MNTNHPILRVPTNVVTGFLGVGKTSAILNLIKQKPQNERWAILVNEFGEIGIDGSLIRGQGNIKQQIFVREVPGGCMCCSAGVPMQIALNQLLKQSRPDRLLIEPTGLGHPKEVMQTLKAENFSEILSIQKTITLVDARHLNDPRYTNHDTFNQQIAIADTIIANKADLYQESDKELLYRYVKDRGQRNAKILFSSYGNIPINELMGITQQVKQQISQVITHIYQQKSLKTSGQNILQREIQRSSKNDEGFKSIGWQFASTELFDYQQLRLVLEKINVERLKVAVITNRGLFGYNSTTDGLTETALADCPDSRIEIICKTIDNNWETDLRSCLIAESLV
ncbi:CobW family GTP-binding protein [Celerinatantimonas sp. MCCC 1A17872]|uniref:CobW family GTP-binding protein n=1 Tax=Celerinatantimonas sp. MCCC 1A17872 TaxID=3177514 RepID=UPI0038C594A2